MSKDYYAILGVSRNASKEEIKKAFRKIAQEHHPDRKGGDPEKFKAASEAYSVLGDDKKRAEYDAYGRVFSGEGGASGFEGFGSGVHYDFDLGDIFSEFGDIFGGFGARGGRGARRGRDISIDIELSFKESVFGTTRKMLLTKTSACDVCTGSGGKPGTTQKTCTICNGNGKIHETKNSILGTFTSVRICDVCRGVGTVPEEACSACRGQGVVRKEQEITVAIPSGVSNGEMVRLSGAGEAVAGGSPGDLYVKLHVNPDPIFSKDKENLRMRLPLKLSDALLGSTQKIELLDGSAITVKTPPGVAHGEILRVRGKGVPIERNRRGDLLITIEITLPKRLSRKSKKLIEELKEEGI